LKDLRLDILSDFSSLQELGDPIPPEWDVDPTWLRKERRRQRDRERKQRARDEEALFRAIMRRKALQQIREAEGIAEEICPVCGVVFPVERGGPGRPRVYCGVLCKVRAAVRAWRERRKAT
jgi:hypothetical protein